MASAFVRGAEGVPAPAPSGALSGLDFAVKDVFDIAGCVTGAGNPRWRSTHAPAAATAPTVTRLLQQGARAVGVTVTDELALSLSGENVHDGAPLNPAARGCVAGGSSAGSASAVASGLTHFALGTDTGGSVRVPAGFCGLYGLRPTHGRIDSRGVVPLAPRFDTVGIFAENATVLARVAVSLLAPSPTSLPASAHAETPIRWLWDDAVMNMADADVGTALRLAWRRSMPAPTLTAIADPAGRSQTLWADGYLTLQAAEIARVHGPWLRAQGPLSNVFAPLIASRFERALASANDSRQQAQAHDTAQAVRARLSAVLTADAVLLLPTSAVPAPKRGLPDDVADAWTYRTLGLTALAGLAGCPQISIPLTSVGGRPVGLGLLAAPGGDEVLLRAATAIERQLWPR